MPVYEETSPYASRAQKFIFCEKPEEEEYARNREKRE